MLTFFALYGAAFILSFAGSFCGSPTAHSAAGASSMWAGAFASFSQLGPVSSLAMAIRSNGSS